MRRTIGILPSLIAGPDSDRAVDDVETQESQMISYIARAVLLGSEATATKPVRVEPFDTNGNQNCGFQKNVSA
jgi:hypothetical protein